MKITMQTITAVCLLILGSLSFMAASPAAEKSKVERGRYIVQGMAACGDCHTPTNEKGEPLPGKDLRAHR